MEAAEAQTLVLSIHAISIPIVITTAYKFGDRSEWLQKSLSGVDALLLRLRQNLSESLRAKLATLPPPPPLASALVVNELGQPHPLPAVPANQGEAYRDSIHDFVRENVTTLRYYSTVLGSRDAWAGWARLVSWSALLLAVWQLAAGAIVLAVKAFMWTWSTKMLFSTLAPTALLVGGILLGFVGTLVHHDRIMDVRRTNDPL